MGEVLWKISLPMVSPLLLVSLIYCVIDSFTGVGNRIISRVGYECFTAFNFGIGSAVAWSYLIVVLLIVAVVFLIANRFISYDT
jgi:ABC-type sugar transport system permease subunit